MVSKDELKHLGWISRINLSEEEIETFHHQLGDTIKYIDVLETLDSENLNLDSLEIDFSNLREDKTLEFTKDLIPKSVPAQEGYVKGPKMI
ncbi:MAG: Asp-tRNA(Asn)/Glu-tRNA(Gln) amidotransferase subunit GatC [Thermoproteota archaeon]|nr:Asp-tRNA(Asn)/Glu-tRNA(Gln) amidotransferase subunit GatC [Thermoproteota archaeon]